jgi:hypothetical protein
MAQILQLTKIPFKEYGLFDPIVKIARFKKNNGI